MKPNSLISDYLAEIGRKGGKKSKGGGRPKKYKTDHERKDARSETQRRYRESKKNTTRDGDEVQRDYRERKRARDKCQN